MNFEKFLEHNLESLTNDEQKYQNDASDIVLMSYC